MTPVVGTLLPYIPLALPEEQYHVAVREGLDRQRRNEEAGNPDFGPAAEQGERGQHVLGRVAEHALAYFFGILLGPDGHDHDYFDIEHGGVMYGVRGRLYHYYDLYVWPSPRDKPDVRYALVTGLWPDLRFCGSILGAAAQALPLRVLPGTVEPAHWVTDRSLLEFPA